ncbi:MAG: GGDEF domain-containing protein, partial [Methylococcaceae bacterium]|nr:GGDEF domain-containing protein [Methylococcaceae bacterium]
EQHAIASEIVGRADQALYHAKETGRNRLYFYEKLISEGLLEEQIEEGDIELF